MIRVTINRAECVSCGSCEDICPEFFSLDPDDALSCVNQEYRIDGKPNEGLVPESLESCVAEAAECCPVQVITLS
jgi:ferredoxin